jgi:hypothetical protein
MNPKNQITKINKNTGFTFLEVIIAVFIISLGVVGMVRIIPAIISNTSINSSRFTAAYLAQDGIEIIRNIRDGNWLEDRTAPTAWDEGIDGCSGGCEADYTILNQENPAVVPYAGRYLNIGSSGFYGYSAGVPTKFKRKITVVAEGGDILKVSADVFWQDKNKNYQFSAQEKLYKWR